MYGKHFASMYDGSMVGAGLAVFAVMGYVVSNMVPDKEVGAQVALNPKLLAYIFGATQDDVQSAIDYLCAPDPESRSKEEDGKRLIKIGQFEYKVVNGPKYMAIRDEEDRRRQYREAKARARARAKTDKEKAKDIAKFAGKNPPPAPKGYNEDLTGGYGHEEGGEI